MIAVNAATVIVAILWAVYGFGTALTRGLRA